MLTWIPESSLGRDWPLVLPGLLQTSGEQEWTISVQLLKYQGLLVTTAEHSLP